MAGETNIEELDLDTVMGTGENKDRKPVETPPTLPPSGEETQEEKDKKAKEAEENRIAEEKAKKDNQSNQDDSDIDLTSFRTSIISLNNENLDEDSKKLKEDILSKYKGKDFNDNGDVIDQDGKVIKSIEDVYKEIEQEESVLLDSNGNQVDAEGKIIKTKFDLAAENSVVNKLHKESKYSFVDEKGEPKIYKDNEEGIADYTNDLAEEKAREINSRLFNSNPIIPEVIKHLLSGKDISQFNKVVDYSKINVKDLNENQKLSYIKDALIVDGMSEEKAESYLKFIVDSNKIDSELKSALNDLQENQEELKAKRNKDYQEAVQKQQKETIDYWTNVEEHIKKDNVKFVNIPSAEKEKFYAYMSQAIDDDGNSQHLLDKANQSLEEEIGLAYLRYKGFNFDSVINKKVNEKRVLSLKERIKRSASKANNQNTSKETAKVNPADANLKISDILP